MRPQVVAHRGASHEQPEHTLGAYLAALDAGADALECDVRLTADGHLVCVHDRNLRRTAASTGIVSRMTLTELDELDFASWKNPWAGFDDEAPEYDRALGKVLTLRHLMEVVRDYDRPVELAIETKHPVRFGGLVERRLAQTLEEFGWEKPGAPVRVLSFSWTALQRMERLATGVDLVMLIDKAHHWPMLRQVIGPDWKVGPKVQELRDHPGLGRRLVDSGRDIHVWVVNTADDLQVCLDHGAKAVISDRPSFMLELLDG